MTPILHDLFRSLCYLGKYDKTFRLGVKLTEGSPVMLFSVLLPGLNKDLSYGYMTIFNRPNQTLLDAIINNNEISH